VGWTCGVALAWHFVGQPIAIFVITFAGVDAPPLPVFEMESLLTVLLGMLGLGGLRTFEKTKQVAREK
jgi:predicted aspartyl protease